MTDLKKTVSRLTLLLTSRNGILRARDFYAVIVDEGEARISYHLLEIESEFREFSLTQMSIETNTLLYLWQ